MRFAITILLLGLIILLCVAFQRFLVSKLFEDEVVEQVDFEILYPHLKTGDLVFYSNLEKRYWLRHVHGSRISHGGVVYVHPDRPDDKYIVHLYVVSYYPHVTMIKVHPLKHIIQKEKLVFRRLMNPITKAQQHKFNEFLKDSMIQFERQNPLTGELILHKPYSSNRKAGLVAFDSENEKFIIQRDTFAATMHAIPTCFLNHLTPLQVTSQETLWCSDFLLKVLIHLRIVKNSPRIQYSCQSFTLFQIGSEEHSINDFMLEGNSYEEIEYLC